MKKKIILALMLVALFTCLFAVAVSAVTTESSYAISFDVVFSGETEYTTIYTANTDNHNPRIYFNNGFYKTATYNESTKKYTFTDAVDNSQIVKIDFSTATPMNSVGTVVKGVGKPDSPLTNCQEVKWFTAEGSTTQIVQDLFANWTTLKSFDFGCVATIDVSSFKNTGFETLTIPATVTQMKNSPFENCANLKTLVIEGALPNGVGTNMFMGCTSLETATMNNIGTLGTRMFKNCTSLTTVTAPNATVIKEEAFGSTCTALETITLTWSGITSIELYAFQTLTCLPETLDLANVTTIGSSAFNTCTSLKTVNMPNIASLGSNAFNACTSLTTVNMSNVASLGTKAFYGCTALTSVDLGDNVTSIGESVFEGCTSISSVTLGDIPYFGKGMFKGCTAITSVVVPSTVTEFKDSSFSGCTSLTSINIPEGVTYLGICALYNTKVKTIHIPSTVESIGYQFAEKSAVETLTFAENSSLTFIDHRAFQECKSLSGTVVLPDGLVTIDEYLFSSCTSLKAVKMPDSVTTLTGTGILFGSCTSLEYVQLSNQLTWLPRSMFENCYALKAISLPDSIKTINYKALRKCTSLEAVYLPSGLTNLGQVSDSSSDWGVFYQSPKVYFVNEPFNVFDGDKLVENFVMPEKPEVYYMPSGLVSLGNSEFQDCNNLNNYIVFPEGVTSAGLGGCGQGAFFGAGKGRTTPLKLVFLGDITGIRIRQNDGAYANIHYIFANPNDLDLNSLTLTIGSANNKNLTNTYMYFCASNTVYDLTTFVAANSTVYTVLETDFAKTVNEADAQPHFHNPKANSYMKATCTMAEGNYTFCFCGKPMTFVKAENGKEALGHIYETIVDKIYPTVENGGFDFYADATYVYACPQCETNVNRLEKGTSLFTKSGFSANEDDMTDVVFIVYINCANIEAYLAENEGVEIVYGLVASANTTGTPLTYADGKVEAAANTVKVDMTGLSYNKLTMRITNVGANELHCAGYVSYNGEISYLNHETTNEEAAIVSLSIINDMLFPSEDEGADEGTEEVPAV